MAFWLLVIGVLYFQWFFKEMYVTTAADFVKYNDVNYVREEGFDG